MRRERHNHGRIGVSHGLEDKKGGGAGGESQDHGLSTMDDIERLSAFPALS
jgi:hypothetical protein